MVHVWCGGLFQINRYRNFGEASSSAGFSNPHFFTYPEEEEGSSLTTTITKPRTRRGRWGPRLSL